MPDFIAEWLNQNEIFTAMTLMEYWDGMVTTVHLVFLSLVIGLLVAVPLAILRTVRNPFVSGPVWLYTYLFRGTPLLIQLYIIYYGIAQIPGIQETFWWEIFREPFYPALLAFTLNTAAYTTEIIRGAIVSTPNGEIEAAKAYGMNWFMRMRRIVLPSAALERPVTFTPGSMRRLMRLSLWRFAIWRLRLFWCSLSANWKTIC